MPRSGSTVLSALLNQSKDLYATPTNDLFEMIVQVRNSWVGCDAFRAQGLDNVRPNIKNMLKGMMQGFYHAELQGGLTVLDKCRGWPAYIELVEEVLGRPIKIITTIRDIKEIVASFERLRAKNPLTVVHGVGSEYYIQQTVMGRAQVLLDPQGTIGLTYHRLVDAFDRGLGDRFYMIPYKSIIESPQAVCVSAFAFLNVKPIQVETTDLKNHDTRRDVDVWGLPLHRIRLDGVEDQSQPWHEVIPDNVAKWIDSEFARIKVPAQT